MSPNPQGRNVADEVWQVSSTGAKSNLIRTLTPGAYLWSMSPKALLNAQKKQRAYYSGFEIAAYLEKRKWWLIKPTGTSFAPRLAKDESMMPRLFKLARIPMLPEQLCLSDKGYRRC